MEATVRKYTPTDKEKLAADLERMGVKDIALFLEAVAEAVAAEREACAQIAERQAAEISRKVCRSSAPLQLMAQAQAKRDVAWEIRGRE